VLDKDTNQKDLPDLFKPMREGFNMGIISESGCPGVADPGATGVLYAHQQGYPVVPLVGPSSLLLALMASGLNGQQFAFHGYLPIESKEAAAAIKNLEKESQKRNQTQIFIETPYRNNSILNALLSNLSSECMLTIAVDITGPAESIRTQPVKMWKADKPELPKTPAVFLFLA
jgi:16S rRNA (cytidine1402-2'-O)-methyltransferase